MEGSKWIQGIQMYYQWIERRTNGGPMEHLMDHLMEYPMDHLMGSSMEDRGIHCSKPFFPFFSPSFWDSTLAPLCRVRIH